MAHTFFISHLNSGINKAYEVFCRSFYRSRAPVLLRCQKEGVPPPTEKDGEQVWHNLFSQNGADHHRIELLSFKVVNGRRDQDHYLLYFEAQQKWLSTGQVEIKKSYYDFRKTDKGWIGPDEHLYPFSS